MRNRMGKNGASGLLFALACGLFVAAPAQAGQYPHAVFSGLDKTTARVTSFSAKVGEPAIFGSLEVLVRVCDKKPPEELPQTAVFVEIRPLERSESEAVVEATSQEEALAAANNAAEASADDGETRPIFEGWMFAESPGLNALEHPVYDIWLTDCSTRAVEASSGSE